MIDCCMADAAGRGEPHERRTCLLEYTMGGGVEWANPAMGPRKRAERPENRRNYRSDDRSDRFGGKRGLETGKKIGGETSVS